MHKTILSIAITCVVWASLVTTVSAQVRTFTIDSERSELAYSFKSTLHPVKGIARQFSGEFVFDDTEEVGFKSGKVVVEADHLDSENKKRDRNMYKMFEVAQFAQIIYDIDQFVNIKPMGDDSYKGIFKGQLTIKDVSRNIDIDVTFQKVEGGYILVGICDISLEAFRLKPPSVLGVIRVFDAVQINFKVYIK